MLRQTATKARGQQPRRLEQNAVQKSMPNHLSVIASCEAVIFVSNILMTFMDGICQGRNEP